MCEAGHQQLAWPLGSVHWLPPTGRSLLLLQMDRLWQLAYKKARTVQAAQVRDPALSALPFCHIACLKSIKQTPLSAESGGKEEHAALRDAADTDGVRPGPDSCVRRQLSEVRRGLWCQAWPSAAAGTRRARPRLLWLPPGWGQELGAAGCQAGCWTCTDGRLRAGTGIRHEGDITVSDDSTHAALYHTSRRYAAQVTQNGTGLPA